MRLRESAFPVGLRARCAPVCPPKFSNEGRVRLPVRRVAPFGHLRQERLDLRPSQVAPSPTRVPGEEASNPRDAVRDGLLLRAGLPEHRHVTRRPLRRVRIDRCHGPRSRLMHITPPPLGRYASKLRHKSFAVSDVFEAYELWPVF